MKSPETVMRSALVGSTAVTSIVGTRIYPVLAPASAPLPLVTWRRSGITRSQTLGNPMGVPQVSVEYQIFAATYETAREVADAMRLILDGYGGTVDNVEVKQVALTDESDDLVPQEGAETSLYSVRQQYEIWWQET